MGLARAAAAAQSQAGPGGCAQAQFVPGEPQVGRQGRTIPTSIFTVGDKLYLEKALRDGNEEIIS